MKDFLDKIRLSLLPHKKAVGYVLVAFITVFLLFQCMPRAEAVEVRFDPAARVLRGEAAVIRYSVELADIAPGIRPVVGLGILGASNDPEWGPDANNGFYYGGISTQRGRFHLTIGVGQLMRQTLYSGTQTQFILEARVDLFRYKQWGIGGAWFHASNSGINKPNPGFDFVGPTFFARW